MRPFLFLLFSLLSLGLLPGCAQGQPETTATPGRPAALPHAVAPAMLLPELQYEEGSAIEAIQARIVLPFGIPVPVDTSRVVVTLVVGALGEVTDEKIVRGLSPAVDEAVLYALHDNLPFRPVQRNGQYENAPYTLTIWAPGAASPAQRREATTRWQRTAHRRPGEADSTFVQRVLPRAYSAADEQGLLPHAWRPSAFGQQLFFARRGGADNEYGTDLFVPDPYQPTTYAVQVLPVGSLGDLTHLAALFFADANHDANHDGRQDLLTLAACALREQHKSEDGEMLDGHWNHYRTDVWQHAGPDEAGRPQYRPDPTPRPYLDELARADAVRQALARHLRRPARPVPAAALPEAGSRP